MTVCKIQSGIPRISAVGGGDLAQSLIRVFVIRWKVFTLFGVTEERNPPNKAKLPKDGNPSAKSQECGEGK